jgi:hypothetical protein
MLRSKHSTRLRRLKATSCNAAHRAERPWGIQMSDIDRPTLQRAPKLVARKCDCGEWAGFGFGKGAAVNWWCWNHYPYKTSARLEAAEIAESLMRNIA